MKNKDVSLKSIIRELDYDELIELKKIITDSNYIDYINEQINQLECNNTNTESDNQINNI